MKIELWFPCLQILTCIGAAGVYSMKDDWLHVAYWLAAAVLTTTVTLMNG